jgi:hypothetical protein
MPQIEVDISCPGCNAIFTVPVELCGEMAECTECSAVFEIPKVGEVPPTLNTDSGAIKGILAPTPSENNATAATNTVKLSRASIGMIPNLKDSFTFGQSNGAPNSAPSFTAPAPQQPPVPVLRQPIPPPPHQQLGTQPQPKLTFTQQQPPQAPPPAKPLPGSPAANTTTSQKSVSQTTSSTQTSISGQQIAQALTLPPWTKVQLRQGEELLTFRETKKSSGLTAVLASLPVLMTVVSVFYAKTDLILAVVLVIVIWALTFILALFMAKNSSKRALILTSQRTICIIGKDKIELKK